MAITSLSEPLPNSSSMTEAQYNAAWNKFLAELPVFGAEANAMALAMNLNSLNSSSATSVSYGLGDKTFTIEAGRSWLPGMGATAADSANGTLYMRGVVKSYSGTTLVITVDKEIGSGSNANWSISFGNPPEPKAIAGQLILLDTIVDSGATQVDIENSFSDYNEYVIRSDDLKGSTAASTQVRLKIAGVYLTTASYNYQNFGGVVTSNATSITVGNNLLVTANGHAELELKMRNPSNSSRSTLIGINSDTNSGGQLVANKRSDLIALNVEVGAITGVRFYPSTGTMNATFKLYGVVGV